MYRLFFILAFASTSILSAQNIKDSMIHVKGTVLDSDGGLVKKVIIYVDSVKTFIKTNKRGFYSIELPSDTKQLMAFSTKYGMVAGNLEGEELNFQFQKDQAKISETELKQLGFTVDTNRKGRVDPANYKDYPSIYTLISAMFTGITVRGNQIIVRGIATLGSDASEPLAVVDGNYISSMELEQFSPRDVKSIELLKDGDSALYGARGASGVFIITLKK